MRLLIVTAVDQEARAIGAIDSVTIVVAGIGRVNAACATTAALLGHGDGRAFDAVLSCGIAGMLPGSPLDIGAVVVASSCVYVEEGLMTPEGFRDMRGLGFSLGDFEGNAVPVDATLLARLRDREGATPLATVAPIATVATCSGTDAAAAEVVRRTGAVAEAMEGAAVVHAARRLGVPAIELRVISNTTGDRPRQRWDLPRALAVLGPAVRNAVALLRQ